MKFKGFMTNGKTEEARVFDFQNIPFNEKAGFQIITDELAEELIGSGFFRTPASLKHHGTYEGGLYDHSLTVMQALVDLTERLNLQWERPVSPYIVGFFSRPLQGR